MNQYLEIESQNTLVHFTCLCGIYTPTCIAMSRHIECMYVHMSIHTFYFLSTTDSDVDRAIPVIPEAMIQGCGSLDPRTDLRINMYVDMRTDTHLSRHAYGHVYLGYGLYV